MKAILLLGMLLLLLTVRRVEGDSYARILAEQMAGEKTTTMTTTTTTETTTSETIREESKLGSEGSDEDIVGEDNVEEEDGGTYGYDYVEEGKHEEEFVKDEEEEEEENGSLNATSVERCLQLAEDSDVRELLLHVTDIKTKLPPAGLVLGEEKLEEKMAEMLTTKKGRENLLEVVSRTSIRLRKVSGVVEDIKRKGEELERGLNKLEEGLRKLGEEQSADAKAVEEEFGSMEQKMGGKFKDLGQQLAKLTRMAKELKDGRSAYEDCRAEKEENDKVLGRIDGLEVVLTGLTGSDEHQEELRKRLEDYKAQARPTLENCLSPTVVVWAPALAIICVQTGILLVMCQRFCRRSWKSIGCGRRATTSDGGESGGGDTGHIQGAPAVDEQVRGAVAHQLAEAAAQRGGRGRGGRRFGPPVLPKKYRLDSQV